MADVLVFATTAAFFILCVGLIRGCDRIIGPDDLEDLEDRDEADGLVAEAVSR